MFSYNYSWTISYLWHLKRAVVMRKEIPGQSIALSSSCTIKKWETKGNESKEKLIQDTDKSQSEKHNEKNQQDGRSI